MAYLHASWLEFKTGTTRFTLAAWSSSIAKRRVASPAYRYFSRASAFRSPTPVPFEVASPTLFRKRIVNLPFPSFAAISIHPASLEDEMPC